MKRNLPNKRFWLITLLAILLSACRLNETNYFGLSQFKLNGSSMLPAIAEGDILYIDEEAYETVTPERGDLILYQFPFDTELLFVKRVIGLPGEQIEIIDGMVYIDGVLLSEPYVQQPASYNGTWEIESDSYFVLGDNRNNSSDSHNWGTLGEAFILGKVIAICTGETADTCTDVTPPSYGTE